MYGSLSLFVRVCAYICVQLCADALERQGWRQQIFWQNAAAAAAMSPSLLQGCQDGSAVPGSASPGSRSEGKIAAGKDADPQCCGILCCTVCLQFRNLIPTVSCWSAFSSYSPLLIFMLCSSSEPFSFWNVSMW